LADSNRTANVYQSGSSTPSNPQPRGASNDLRSGLPSNTNVNTNATPLSNTNARAGLPSLPQQQDPSSRPPVNPVPPPVDNLEPSGTNLSQTSPQPTNPLPQSSLGSSFPPNLNQNRPPLTINPHSNLVGFPTGIYSHINHRSQTLPSRFLAQQEYFRQRNRLPLSTRLSSFRPRATHSNFELDYPIENVIVDENIPSALALKVNEAIDYDRLGNAYYSHRYAYEPISQRISIGHNQQIQRRLIGNSRPSGIRHIREITNEDYYPQRIQIEDLQPIYDVTPSFDCQIISTQYNLDSFPTPIHHYIACAVPNDPMRRY
jgi:hypothetical protein